MNPIAPSPAQHQQTARGFTLLELTAVVTIIAIFAAIALPQITRQLQHQRVQDITQRIAELYRGARMRAMGQGGAVLVRYERASPNQQGQFTIREAVLGDPTNNPGICEHQPVPRCNAATWDNTQTVDPIGGTARDLEQLVLANEYNLDSVYARAERFTGIDDPVLDICYTPMGRAYIRQATAGPFVAMAGLPVVRVFRTTGTDASPLLGLERRVLILPSGAARTRAVVPP